MIRGMVFAMVLCATPAWGAQFEYIEPTTNACGGDPACPQILDDLAFTTVYYKIDNAAVQTIVTPAPSMMGGAHQVVDVPTTNRTKRVTVWATATDTAGQEGPSTPTLTKHYKGRP